MVVWFITLDLMSGYWQVKMDEASRPLTAFSVGQPGFCECDWIPFGLLNAPATFQRLLETYLSELQLNWCLIYLNDFIVFSKTQREHLAQLRGVFWKLKEVGLKSKPSKCEFFKKSLTCLGHKQVLRLMTTR